MGNLRLSWNFDGGDAGNYSRSGVRPVGADPGKGEGKYLRVE